MPVIVSDREGRYVSNLIAENFKLYDNSNRQKISYFDAAEEPLNIALLLDTSRSTEGVLENIKKAAKQFLTELRPQDRAMVVSFDYEVHTLSDFTSDRKVLEKAIKSATVGRDVGTKLNDAVDQVSSRNFKTVTGRKAIILLSDGDDFGSILSGSDLVDKESEAEGMIYSIFYQSNPGGFFYGRQQFPGGFPRLFPRGGGGFPFSSCLNSNLLEPQYPIKGNAEWDDVNEAPTLCVSFRLLPPVVTTKVTSPI